jgi:hypothetical protein
MSFMAVFSPTRTMLPVAARASLEAIIQAESNHVELIAQRCVERCGETDRRKKRDDSNCFGAKIECSNRPNFTNLGSAQ